MAEEATATPLPGIAALPPTTARQIGSGQVLADASSNRALVCRQYYTSKIRDFYDLKEVGGKWLGFRGEALSSTAELSGTLSVTTRVEGEPVAVKLRYGRDGELVSTERDSHPVGATVKASQFFEIIPVRKQTAIKNSAKCLAKIRRLMQAYALARPAIRFRLHVLKAKNNKSDFIYAPKVSLNLEDAVLKVIGKDCALQCDWTALESDAFEIYAFLPKPTAVGSKIANQGAFISIDSRPVSSSRGTIKKIVTAFKERLRKSNLSLASVKDPFFCMNIICPSDSYDPNIEPAKDDVMFDDVDIVLSAVDKLLKAYYPEAIRGSEDIILWMPDQEIACGAEDVPMRAQTPIVIYEDPSEETNKEPAIGARSDQPRWRSSMYGIDEDDVEFLQENLPPALEEEEGIRAVAVSNPWTIARMNSPVRPKTLVANGQLPSPAKIQGEAPIRSSSPAPFVTPCRVSPVEPLTPQTSSRIHEDQSSSSRAYNIWFQGSERSSCHDQPQSSTRPLGRDHLSHQFSDYPTNAYPADSTKRDSELSRPVRDSHTQHMSRPPNLAPHRSQKKQQPQSDNSFVPPDQDSNDTWLGQPMRGFDPVQPSRRQKRRKDKPPFFPSLLSSAHRRTILPAVNSMVESHLTSENNTDIRDFFGHPERDRIGHGLSSTPTLDRLPLTTSNRRRPLNGYALPITYHPSSAGSERPSLVPMRASDIRSALDLHRHDQFSNNASETVAHFKAYQDREDMSAEKSGSPVRRQESRIVPAHEAATKSRPQRRRTTDGAQRSKSSKLPLERVPHGYHIQNIVLPVHLSIASIVYSSRKLDMRRSSLEWSYAADDAYNVFAEAVTTRKVMDWAIKLDNILHKRCQRLPGADTRSPLHETVQQGLDARKADEVMGTVEGVEVPGPAVDDVVHKMGTDVRKITQHQVSPQPKDEISVFDMSQFIDTDMATLNDEDVQLAPRLTGDYNHVRDVRAMGKHESLEHLRMKSRDTTGTDGASQLVPMIKNAEDDFGDDFEDDMLLDF
ncbi:hypothetical protein CC86DRAFT_443052 [Ophiobolus disseminans]|uniref:DNA mismatch repair protein S5 domain-containing protein n=1 Tax=Ophiobolus disseminans TaxID=1469910 RepID=A0A6A7ADT1_9PLEO|nr:hypothetical protein CC86DRAFT_443052 [Ophiobolus disseminans]